MRDWVEQVFNRGLNWVRHKGALDRGQSYVASNVEFTKSTVRCRSGIEDAYLLDGNTVALVPSIIRRFYRLNADATVSKFFFKILGDQGTGGTNGLWVADSDWSDDTPLIPVNAWTAVTDSSGGVTWGSGNMKDSFQSKEWCYFFPEHDSSDNNDDSDNVPIRTNGTDYYKMGLTPPPALRTTDHSLVEALTEIDWEEHFDADIQSNVMSNLLVNRAGTRAYLAYRDPSTTFLELGTCNLSDGTWTTELVEGTAVGNVNARTIALDFDRLESPVIAWADAASPPNINYSTRDPDSSAWTTETVAATAASTASPEVAMAMDGVGRPHIVYTQPGAATDEAVHAYLDEPGSWTSVGQPSSAGSYDARYPAVAFDGDGDLHYVFHLLTGGDLYYSKYTGGAWGAAAAIESTANAGHGANLWVDGDGTNIHVSHYQIDGSGNYDLYYALSTNGGSSWGTKEEAHNTIVDVAGSQTPNHTSIHVDDAGNVLIAALGTQPDGAAAGILEPWLAARAGADEWSANPIQLILAGSERVTIASSRSTYYYGFSGGGSGGLFVGDPEVYYYRLTAEYDDGRLGESGPSDATPVYTNKLIGETIVNVLDLDDSDSAVGTYYDLAGDATRINVYRTTKKDAIDGIYYRVGYLELTAGAPTGDFADSVSDYDLVVNPILDTDVYLPPKFQTGVIWRDRAVISDLKTRDFTAEDGSQLDQGDDGIHRNRIRFSEAFHPDKFPTLNFIDLLPDGSSGRVQRRLVNAEEDQLYIFFESDVMALIGDSVLGERGTPFRPVNIAKASGTPARRSPVYAKGYVFYWTKRGVEVIYRGVSRDISSETVSAMWNQRDTNHPAYAYRVNMDKIGQVAGVYDQELQQIRWSYPAASSTVNSRELVLHLNRWFESGSDGVFSINTYGYTAYDVWDGEGDRGELFGAENDPSSQSFIYRLNYGREDSVSVAGFIANTPIVMTLKTGLEDFGRPDLIKRFKNLRLGGKSGVVDVDVVVDVDGAYTANVSNLDFSTGGIARQVTALPRAANGRRAGVQITATHTLAGSTGPEAFELYDLAWWYGQRQTRARNVS